MKHSTKTIFLLLFSALIAITNIHSAVTKDKFIESKKYLCRIATTRYEEQADIKISDYVGTVILLVNFFRLARKHFPTLSSRRAYDLELSKWIREESILQKALNGTASHSDAQNVIADLERKIAYLSEEIYTATECSQEKLGPTPKLHLNRIITFCRESLEQIQLTYPESA